MNTEELGRLKKRMMFIKGDDFYFIAYNSLLLLSELECDSQQRLFKDHRKLSFLVDFVSDPRLSEIVALAKDENCVPSTIDTHGLTLAYSHGASRQHITMRIACALETKGIMGIERGTQKEGFDVYLNRDRLPADFLSDDLYEVERHNIHTLRRLLPQLRVMKLRTMLGQLFVRNGVDVWHA
jgi:hypothetical protein